jgi:WD40 repeat protein/serine/threonine protein kinase
MAGTDAQGEALLAAVAEDYLERLRSGARPAISEYTRRYPEFAERIEEFLPTLGLVEVFKPGSGDATGSFGAATVSGPEISLERLGDFRILREVGRGGMGIVYEAEQESLGRRVALKVLLASRLLDGKLIARFDREAKAAARLHHTNIVPVFGVGESDGVRYYVMQFIRGLGLDRVLDEIRSLEGISAPVTGSLERGKRDEELDAADMARSLASGQFSPSINVALEADLGRRSGTDKADDMGGSTLTQVNQSNLTMARDSGSSYFRSVARLGLQVAEALAYAHEQGTLHRDIKPSNLLLDSHGTVWVTDFGLAKASADSDLTHTGDVVGTIRYMAPERFAGRCDARSDVYALGLTLYELLAKRPAFAADDRNALLREVTLSQPVRLRRISRAIPRDLETIIFKAIEKDPGHRYDSAADLAEDLRRYSQDRPIAARRVTSVERLVRWGRRNPLVAALLTAIFLLLATVASVTSKLYVETRYRAIEEERAREQALQANATLETKQTILERLLYATSLKAAQSAWESDNAGLCRDMLENVRPRGNTLDLRGFEWHFWRRRFRPAIRTLPGYDKPVCSVAASRDGSRIAAGGFDGTVLIWNADSGKLLIRLAGSDIVHAVAFKPDAQQIAAACADGIIRVWSTADGRLLHGLDGHQGRVWNVAFAPDGRRLASAGADGTTRLWDTESGALLQTHRGKVTRRRNVAFSPDGTSFASVTADAVVSVWGVDGGADMATIRFDNPVEGIRLSAPQIECVRFSPDGRSLFANSLGSSGLIEWRTAGAGVFSLERFRPVDKLDSQQTLVRLVAFDLSESGTIARLNFDGTIRIDSKASGSEPMTLDLGAADIRSLALLPDGERLVTAGPGPAVTVWDTRPRPSVRTFVDAAATAAAASSENPEACIAVSPDGRRVACAGGAMPIRVRDVETGRVVSEFGGNAGSIQTIAYCPDGRYIAAGGTDELIHIWDASSCREVATLKGNRAPVGRLSFSPDGKTLASAGLGGLVRVWEVESGLERFRIPDDSTASVVTFSADGKILASDGFRKIRLIDTRRQQILRSAEKPAPDEVFITALSFSPSGTELAGACSDGILRIWDIVVLRGDTSAPRPRLILRGHGGRLASVAYSPDGRRLASAGVDGTVRLWHPVGGHELLTLKGHDRPVTSVVFSPDGNRIISVGDDRTIKVWIARDAS